MLGQYKTPEGYILTAYSVGYMDFGLQVENPEGDVVFNNPCELCSDAHGVNPPENMDWDEWEAAGYDPEGEPWSPQEWKETLKTIWLEARECYDGSEEN